MASSNNRTYIAIDLKSFYASVECVERGLDPLDTLLVVADVSRTEKTICLAVSPALKKHGIPGRPRLFEVVARVRQVNQARLKQAPGHAFSGTSTSARNLRAHPECAVDYIAASPRMALYIAYSTRIYNIYLKYVAPEDIHVYSIDEVLIDVTAYLDIYRLSPRALAMKMIREVLEETGITATVGIGSNLYLCKVAMDIEAKRSAPDANGVRIAELTERAYRQKLWSHKPITDFWRIGRGYAKKLAAHGMYTMGDVARCSIGDKRAYHNEDLLYKLFGVNAELLIDHAWGFEPCTIADVKAYKPSTNSIGSGQVLPSPYTAERAGLIVREMTDALVLDLVDKNLVTDQIVITIEYDAENLKRPEIARGYHGAVTIDPYGRKIPKHAHGTTNLKCPGSSGRQITQAAAALYRRIANENLLVRKLYVTFNHVAEEQSVTETETYEQLDLFTDYAEELKAREAEERELAREKKMQQAVLEIRKKFGKNAILKGRDLEEGATAAKRNKEIGGHKAD